MENKVIIFPSKKMKVEEEFLPPGKIYAFITGKVNIAFILSCFDKPYEISSMKWGEEIQLFYRRNYENETMANLRTIEESVKKLGIAKTEAAEMLFKDYLKK